MSFTYTEDSLKQLGYAGVATTRISELVHGYQFDPSAPRSRALPINAANTTAAGRTSDYMAPPVRTGKCCQKTQGWDRAGVSSRALNEGPSFRGESEFGAGPRKCYNRRFNFSKSIMTQKPQELNGDDTERPVFLNRRPQAHKRRLATAQEERSRFSRTYICTDKKAGRTEIMTARRCGAAHLDLDLNRFDVYASHHGHRLLRQSEVYYEKENLGQGLVPHHEESFRPGKARLAKPSDHVESEAGFLTTRHDETREKQELGYLRRKIAAEWSRSNRSCFGLAEGYQPMHWRISPEKPLINVSYLAAPGGPNKPFAFKDPLPLIRNNSNTTHKLENCNSSNADCGPEPYPISITDSQPDIPAPKRPDVSPSPPAFTSSDSANPVPSHQLHPLSQPVSDNVVPYADTGRPGVEYGEKSAY